MPSTGGKAVQITQNGASFGFESFDGRYLFLCRGAKGKTTGPIYQIDLSNLQESIAIEQDVYAFRWAVNPEGIYYIVKNNDQQHILKLYRYPQRTIEQIGIFSKWCLFSDVSDDGKYMLLWHSEDYSSDIFLVENFR